MVVMPTPLSKTILEESWKVLRNAIKQLRMNQFNFQFLKLSITFSMFLENISKFSKAILQILQDISKGWGSVASTTQTLCTKSEISTVFRIKCNSAITRG